MKRLLWAAFAWTICSLAIDSQAWVGVPPPNPGGAHFVRGKDPGSIIAQGGHGARLVAFDRALVAGSDRAVLKIEEHDGAQGEQVPQIVLQKGAFVLYVGSSPVKVQIGPTTVTLKSASLMLMDNGRIWLGHAAEVWEGGFARVVSPGLEVPAEGEGHIEVEHRLELGTGDSFQLPKPGPASETPQGKPQRATKRDVRQLFPVISKLFITLGEQNLATFDVEDPKDLLPPKSLASSTEDSPEIDGIEIELDADCVEVCVD